MTSDRYQPGDLVTCAFYGQRVWRVRGHKPAPYQDAVILESLDPDRVNSVGYVSELRLTADTHLARACGRHRQGRGGRS